MSTNASTAMQLDLAKARSARLDGQLEIISAMSECPQCGAVGVYAEQPVARQAKPPKR